MAFDEEHIDPHGECAHEIDRLKAEVRSLREALETREREHAAELVKVRNALAFYTNPFDRLDEFARPIEVPDFYRELNFGERAKETLDALPIEQKGQSHDR